MTMNIFKMIDKKMGWESHYTLNYEAYDVKGNLIESNTLTDQNINDIVTVADNNKAATISFNVKYDYTNICICQEMTVDYFIKSNIIEAINNTKHYNMSRRHRKQLNNILN